jgi:predicted RNase H-like HicB family nuclease
MKLEISNESLDVKSLRSDEAAASGIMSRSAGEVARWIQENQPLVSVELIAGIPVALLHDYAEAAVRHARTQEIEPGQWFSEIVGFEGLWGEGSSREMAEADLLVAIPGWVELRLNAGADVPQLGGYDLNYRLAG